MVPRINTLLRLALLAGLFTLGAFAEDRYLVKVIGDVNLVAQRHGLTVVTSLTGSASGQYVLSSKNLDPQAVLRDLKIDFAVQTAEPEQNVTLPGIGAGARLHPASATRAATSMSSTMVQYYRTAAPSAYVGQAAAAAINLSKAQTLASGKGALIATIDTGVDFKHPVLAGSLVSGRDFTNPATGSTHATGAKRRGTQIMDDQETTPILDDGDGQETTPILDDDQETTPILDDGQETTPILDGQETTPILDQETTPILDTNQETTPILDTNQETTPILDTNQVGSPLMDDGQETTPILDGSSAMLMDQKSTPTLDQIKTPIVNPKKYPAYGHGTMVAGLLHLVAPGARIMPLKAFGSDGSATISRIVQALYYAADHNVNVVNMSFTVRLDSPSLRAAMDYAVSKGVILVAAAGNDGMATEVWPAAYSKVIGVGSTNGHQIRSLFSNFGNSLVKVAAPGEAVITTYPSGHYAQVWGTSFSASFVAGGAALLVDINGKTNQSAATAELGRAKEIGQELGAGELDLYRACLAAMQK
jgi:subtilisin family serine protease